MPMESKQGTPETDGYVSTVDDAIARVQALGTGTGLTDTIDGLERRRCSTSRDDAAESLRSVASPTT